ncbi:MAG TPA: uracil-DNA glycosylase [Dehalococcoidia bacterium]|nr:uracil-DNA glycosylase [Dehalococcoidia bacterium]
MIQEATRAGELAALHRAIATCTKCALSGGRTQAVPGEGPWNADVMFVGEGPGFHEDRQGRPFVGRAGQLLDEMLGVAGLQRDEVFITNIVKCRPPENRDPLPNEIAACADYLTRQIELIGPKFIVTLGRYSMARFFPGQSISRIHGRQQTIGGITYVPMYHPAAALRSAAVHEALETDFRRLGEMLREHARRELERQEPEPSAQQLRLI